MSNPFDASFYAFRTAHPYAFCLWWKALWSPAHRFDSLRWFLRAYAFYEAEVLNATYSATAVVVSPTFFFDEKSEAGVHQSDKG